MTKDKVFVTETERHADERFHALLNPLHGHAPFSKTSDVFTLYKSISQSKGN